MAIHFYTKEPLHWARNIYWQELALNQYELVPITMADLLRFLSTYDQIRVENNNEHLSIYAIRNDTGLTPRGEK